MDSQDRFDKALDHALDLGTKKAVALSAEHVTSLATGNPAAGKAAGLATSAVYGATPRQVKNGALAGCLLAVNGAAHIGSIGTAGSLAAAGSFLALAPWLIAGGILVGGLCWLFDDN